MCTPHCRHLLLRICKMWSTTLRTMPMSWPHTLVVARYIRTMSPKPHCRSVSRVKTTTATPRLVTSRAQASVVVRSVVLCRHTMDFAEATRVSVVCHATPRVCCRVVALADAHAVARPVVCTITKASAAIMSPSARGRTALQATSPISVGRGVVVANHTKRANKALTLAGRSTTRASAATTSPSARGQTALPEPLPPYAKGERKARDRHDAHDAHDAKPVVVMVPRTA